MITVVSGTNRPGSRTLLFARHFADQLRELGQEVQLLDLTELAMADFAGEMYDPTTLSAHLLELQDRFILGADRFAFFVPEYNGSYPGVLKLFIDAISVRETNANFGGKYAALVGIASGRAGNLRGMDHLGAALSHMGAWVLPAKLPISSIYGLLDNERVSDAKTTAALLQHARDLVAAGTT